MRPLRRTRTAALIAALILGLVGCTASGSTSTEQEVGFPGERSDAQTPGHVHGLGVDPADGTLYIASHTGVFQRTPNGQLHRVADRWQDTMGFAVVGPSHFLASGHPDLRDDLPPHLGLIESTDAAQTWQPISLQGEVDFHALEVTKNRTYGYDSAGARLMATTDRKQWQTVDDVTLVDIAVDPDHSDGLDRLVASTPTGRLLSYQVDVPAGPAEPEQLNGPPLVFLDWADADTLVGLARDGGVYLSGDGARSWQRTAGVPGEPQALEVTPRRWYAASNRGVHVSTDNGRSWAPLVTHNGEGHTR